MNIKQEDTTRASGYNNNVSASSAALRGTAGCLCGVRGEPSLESGPERAVGGVHLPQQNGSEGRNKEGIVGAVANGGHNGSAQLADNRSVVGSPALPDCKAGLSFANKGLGLEVTVYPGTGLGQNTAGGHQIADGSPCQTVSVCGEPGVDSPSPEDQEATMKNCSCDEASLCFCPSSVFSPGKQQSRQPPQQPQKGSPRHSKSLDSDGRESGMDAVFAANRTDHEGMADINQPTAVEDTEDVKQCKSFMEDLVDRIFNNSASICQEDNAKFGEYCQLAIGRQWFARLIDNQRVNSKKVMEQTFYRLVQFFAVCLFECSDADDFTPGKSLMNMCFTFYHEHEGFPRCDDTTQKSFLFTHLMEQPVWKSLRFWDAAFFDAVHHERRQQSPDNQVNWRHLSSEERESTEILNENIAFGQLATFLHNMMELELSRDMCQQFLDKMATIGNLSADQRDLIQSNIGNHFPVEIEENSRSRRHQKPFNKLVFMKRKTRHESAS